MRDYKFILGVLIKNRFRTNKRGKLSQGALIAICISPLIVLICALLGYLAGLAARQNLLPQLVNVIVGSSQLIVFFFVVQSIISSLYFAEDNAFLSSLPVRTPAIFMARMTQIYVGELLICAGLLLPTLYTVSISAAVQGYYVFPAFYPLVLLITLCAPLLPLAVATILSLPLMWITSFFRKRAAMTTVVTLLLYTALFAVYFALIPNMSAIYDIENIGAAASSVLNKIFDVLYPNKVLILMSFGINGAANFGIWFAITTGIIGLALGLSSLFYRRAAASQLESKARIQHREIKYERRGKITALITRDFKSMFRMPTMAISAMSNVILAPLMIIIMSVSTGGNGMTSIIEGIDVGFQNQDGMAVNIELIQVGLVFLYALLLNAGTNTVASMAFTREGRTFYISRHLPISAKDAIAAKLIYADIFSVIGIVPLFFIAVFLMKISVLPALLFALATLLFCNGANCFAILMDMRRPNLDWKIYSEIQRSNYYILLTFAICFLLGIIVVVIASVFASLGSLMGSLGAQAAFWAVIFVMAGAMSLAGVLALRNRGPALYDKMTDSKIKSVPASGAMIGRGKGGMLK